MMCDTTTTTTTTIGRLCRNPKDYSNVKRMIPTMLVLQIIWLVGLSCCVLMCPPSHHSLIQGVYGFTVGVVSGVRTTTNHVNGRFNKIVVGDNNSRSVGHRVDDPTPSSTSSLFLFDTIFEEEGVLGKGITVGKVQVALQVNSGDRSSPTSIFSLLEENASVDSDANEDLARMTNNVCLDLLRKSDDWIGACSTSQWFPSKDAGKAEQYYNDLSNTEASKFEKEYIPDDDDDDTSSGSSPSTIVVVSLVIEIQGDSTKFDGAGYSLSSTKEVLTSIASDALVDDGYCVNAVEVFWTPSDRQEVMTKKDMIVDFPELIDL